MKKTLSIVSFLLLINTFIFAQNKIKIISPQNESNLYYYDHSELEEKKLISGEVSENCTSIRVIWIPSDKDKLFEYYSEYSEEKPNNGSAFTAKKKLDYQVDDFTLKQYKKGSKAFEYYVSTKLDNLKTGSNYYLFIATFKDGSRAVCSFDLYVYYGGAAEKGKPVIYLYPEQECDVKVSVKPNGGVSQSIPLMNEAWNVRATPEGLITDKQTNETYPYLFWESNDDSNNIDMTEGFVVKTSKLESFFKQKLSILGLNEKEISDFNEFWIPELQGKKYVFINFYSQERIDQEAPLFVEPKPDSVIRVFFDHVKLDKPIKVNEQKLQNAKRNGFAVIEWGGKRYK